MRGGRGAWGGRRLGGAGEGVRMRGMGRDGHTPWSLACARHTRQARSLRTGAAGCNKERLDASLRMCLGLCEVSTGPTPRHCRNGAEPSV
eukprot:363662-Chlamydomonas_euryale.AAC.11